MNTEKDLIYNIGDLIDDKNAIREIIDGIKSGKFNVIKFENINDNPDEGYKAVFIIKNKYKDEIVSSLSHIKDHIISLISGSLSSIEKSIKQ